VGLNDNARPFHPCDRDRPRPTEREQFERDLAETFPARALEVAQKAADVAAPAIVQLAAWSRDHENGIAVVSGVAGCGKTVAAAWLAMQLGNRMRPRFLRASEFARLSRYDAEARARWADPSWLVLDDLGAEYKDAKGSFLADLDELVDVFYAGKRTLVVTTNCTAGDFATRYGERIVDRLRECGTWIAIAGGSMRAQGGR
jgi:DNA replication protein DnaC